MHLISRISGQTYCLLYVDISAQKNEFCRNSALFFSFSRSTRTYVRKALPSDGQPYESSTDLSWQQESDDDDREFEELLRGAKEHNEYEGNEELDDQTQTQETSTDDDAFAYDELRLELALRRTITEKDH